MILFYEPIKWYIILIVERMNGWWHKAAAVRPVGTGYLQRRELSLLERNFQKFTMRSLKHDVTNLICECYKKEVASAWAFLHRTFIAGLSLTKRRVATLSSALLCKQTIMLHYLEIAKP
ncbi:hypothetical protein M514_10568 [Trichuris suis]|uniref:Uncharacterized protein n=1 Tax=Trichuris suis TaxID=68888 RepID=A0A085LUB1_9BILA|nr:hypothetical protein M513_10568 [Trichuris suis]KFD71455.1 hypothetical protein M514_10568 [Trichuris suis]